MSEFEYPPEFRSGGWEPPPRRKARRLRLVGAVVVVALLLAGAVAWLGIILERRLEPPLPPEVTSPRSAAAVQLVTGHCLESLPPHGEVDGVRLVPCEQEHAAEVFSQYAFRAEDVWPGQDEAHARVARACQLPATLLESGVAAVTWAPSPASWDRGDRTGLCIAALPEPTTGTLLTP